MVRGTLLTNLLLALIAAGVLGDLLWTLYRYSEANKNAERLGEPQKLPETKRVITVELQSQVIRE